MNSVFAAYVDFPHPLVGNKKWKCWSAQKPFAICWPAPDVLFSSAIFSRYGPLGSFVGGSLDNAIVLTADGVMNGPLRFPDEFGRHKALDLIGDLALAGLPCWGMSRRTRPGTRCIRNWSAVYWPIPRFGRSQPTKLFTRFQKRRLPLLPRFLPPIKHFPENQQIAALRN